MTTSKMTGEARTRESLDELASAAGSTVDEMIGEGRSRMRGAMRNGRERLSHMRDGIEDRVVDHPFQSLAVAAAVGLLLGILFEHRRT